MSISVYLVMAFMITISAFLQGAGGVGFTMFSAPIAFVIAPELVPGPLLTLGGVVTLLTAIRERHSIAWRSATCALMGRTLGAIIAVVVLGYLSTTSTGVLFSGLILLAVILSVSGLKFRVNRANAGIGGLVSGVMGTLTSVGSPPLAIVFQHEQPRTVRATIGTVLAVGATVSILILAITGYYQVKDLILSAALLPFLGVGFWFSNKIRNRINARTLRYGLLVFCSLSALSILMNTLIFVV